MRSHTLRWGAIVSEHCARSRHLHIKPALVRILLVPDFHTSNFGNDIVFEGKVIFRLRLFVHILYDDIDSLPNIAFVEIRVSHQVHVLKELEWFEVAAQKLLRRLGSCEVRACRAEAASEQVAYSSQFRQLHAGNTWTVFRTIKRSAGFVQEPKA